MCAFCGYIYVTKDIKRSLYILNLQISEIEQMSNIGAVLQPWQIHQVVHYIIDNFTPADVNFIDISSDTPLGNRLAGYGIISSTGNFETSLDFYTSDDLWLELCKKNVVFSGIWSEVYDRAIKRAIKNEGPISMFYDFVYVVSREAVNLQITKEFSPSKLCSSLFLDPKIMREFILQGICERVSSLKKRKFADIEYEIQLIFG